MSDLQIDASTNASPRTDSQSIKIDCWKDAQGKATILEARIPNDYRPDLTDTDYRPEDLDDSIYHKLGEGSTGIAIAAVRKVKGLFGEIQKEKVVLKKYKITSFDAHQIKDGYTSMLREFQILQYLMHDNIAKMKDSFWSLDEKGNLNQVWIVTERMDLMLTHLFRQKAMEDDTATQEPRKHRHLGSILVQILRALDYLHQRGIMHRDVKPDNIGISNPCHLKLFDFGVARSTNTALRELRSTPLYSPLEVQLLEQYDWGVDIWATGLVALEFLNHPFYPTSVDSKGKIKQRILDVFGVPGDKYKEFFKDKLIHEKPRDGTFNAFLTTACTRLEPALWDFDLNEQNFQDLLGKMLCINPRRTSARELLEHKYLKAMNAERFKTKEKKNQSKNTLDDHEPTQLLHLLNALPRTDSQSIKIDREKEFLGKASILEARIPNDYRPDLTDTSYCPEALDDSIYHKLGEGSTRIAIAAVRKVKGVFGEIQIEKVVLTKHNITSFIANQIKDVYSSMRREFQSLQYLMHDNIVAMKDSFWSLDEEGNLNELWIVTERMDFRLSDFFRHKAKKDNTATPEPRDHRHLGSILVQILRALDYLHQRGIMHRVVNPDNMGISSQCHLKLFNFGVARSTSTDLTELVSTPRYHPLEVQLLEQYDWGVDIWATGLVALEFLNHPFYPASVDSTNKSKQRILDVFGVPGDKYKEFFKDKLMNEVQRDGCFNAFLTTAFERLAPGPRDLNEDNLRDLLSQMLCINPRRPLASVLLDHNYLRAMNSDITRRQIQISTNDRHAENQRDKETLIRMLKNFSRQL